MVLPGWLTGARSGYYILVFVHRESV